MFRLSETWSATVEQSAARRLVISPVLVASKNAASNESSAAKSAERRRTLRRVMQTCVYVCVCCWGRAGINVSRRLAVLIAERQGANSEALLLLLLPRPEEPQKKNESPSR